jgi:uncharacterized protein (DUF1778 family)
MKKSQTKSEVLQIRLSPAEKETLKTLAAAAGVSVAGYILGSALGDAIGQKIIDGFGKK